MHWRKVDMLRFLGEFDGCDVSEVPVPTSVDGSGNHFTGRSAAVRMGDGTVFAIRSESVGGSPSPPSFWIGRPR